jgi:BirA family transcriptional regulator, biotin operon repressor / biotin---[acetyl-CoA-carboxylase] ligase
VAFGEGRHLLPPAVTTEDQDDSSFVIRPPSELVETAISLSMALGREVDRVTLLAAILARCEVWYELVLAGKSPHAAWAARLDTVGRRVAVATTVGNIVGMAVDVTPEGALLVRGDDTIEHAVWSGDVTALRRAD